MGAALEIETKLCPISVGQSLVTSRGGTYSFFLGVVEKLLVHKGQRQKGCFYKRFLKYCTQTLLPRRPGGHVYMEFGEWSQRQPLLSPELRPVLVPWEPKALEPPADGTTDISCLISFSFIKV